MNCSRCALWLGLVLAAGCAPNASPLRIANFAPILTEDNVCAITTEEEIFTSGGTLDLAPGNSDVVKPSFLVGLRLVGGNAFTQAPIVVTQGPVIEPGNRSRPIIDRVVLSYAIRVPPGPNSVKPTIKLDPAQLSRTIIFGEDGLAVVAIDLISPALKEELIDPDKVPAPFELLVSVDARGYMSGDRAAVSTGPIVYPIYVTRSPPGSCSSSFRRSVREQCLYPGQGYGSSSPLLCCPAASDGGVGATGESLGCPL
jgi:hypothetical protein